MASARFVVLAALIACAGRQQPEMIFDTPIPRGCEKESKTNESEACVGFWFDQIIKLIGMRTYEDRAITAYVTSVGKRLARAAGDRRNWQFKVLDDPDAQAFVTMGSIVYLYRGTLEILRNEAELAAVLAHEMGHLRGGHAKEKWDELGRDVERTDFEKSLERRYDRDDEIQADETAVLLLARAGYDPYAVETMLRALAGHSHDGVAVEDPDSVHPWWPERIARAQAIAQRRGGELGVDRYRKGVASLVAGPDPRRIALVGEVAVFSHLSLALPLPPHESAELDDDSIIVRFGGDARARISVVNSDFAAFAAAQAKDEKLTMEIHHEQGREAVTILVKGTDDAPAIAKAMRASIRESRPAELAKITPRFVDLDAPRRLWR